MLKFLLGYAINNFYKVIDYYSINFINLSFN